jgi:hypothetical protein
MEKPKYDNRNILPNNKKIIMKRIILISMFMAVCVSCGDSYAPRVAYIDNQTRDTIKITFSGKSPYRMIDTNYLYFPPSNKKPLYGAVVRAAKDGCGYTGIKEGEIEIYTTSGKRLRKDIWNIDNWDCIGSFKQGWEKTFVVTENDLE